MVSKHKVPIGGTVTISISALQAQRLIQRLQSGDVLLNFKQSGQKGGFWGALAGIAGSLALPLVEKGIGALVNKIGGSGHGMPITCTKCQMDKIKQCGAGLRVNFKIRSAGRNPSPGTIQAMQTLQGSGIMSSLKSIIPMVLKVAKPVGKAIGKAAMSGINALLKKGGEKAGEKAADYLEKRFSTSKQKQGPEFDQVDMSLFPAAPTNTSWGPALFPPQDGNGLRLSGHGLQLSGKGKKKNLVPKRFVIKRV